VSQRVRNAVYRIAGPQVEGLKAGRATADRRMERSELKKNHEGRRKKEIKVNFDT